METYYSHRPHTNPMPRLVQEAQHGSTFLIRRTQQSVLAEQEKVIVVRDIVDMCKTLLVQHGIRRTQDFPSTLLALLTRGWRGIPLGISPLDFIRPREFKTTLVDENKRPVRVQVLSEYGNPLKSCQLDIKIKGLPTYLSIIRQGTICSPFENSGKTDVLGCPIMWDMTGVGKLYSYAEVLDFILKRDHSS